MLILTNLILLNSRKVSLVISQPILGYKNMAYLQQGQICLNQICLLYCFESLFMNYLQKFYKIGVLKNFAPLLEALFNQPVDSYIINMRLRHGCSLANFAKLSRTPFLQNTLRLLLLYLWNKT